MHQFVKMFCSGIAIKEERENKACFVVLQLGCNYPHDQTRPRNEESPSALERSLPRAIKCTFSLAIQGCPKLPKGLERKKKERSNNTGLILDVITSKFII
jgi:hypothetical protein